MTAHVNDRAAVALDHLSKAYDLLIMEVQAGPETFELADAASLTCDAVTQLNGHIRNRDQADKPTRYDFLGGAA